MALAILIGVAGFFMPADLLIFYLAPIFVASWYGGWRVGSVISIYCALAWFLKEAVIAGINGVDAVEIWALVARLAVFLLITRIASMLHHRSRLQTELTHFIVHDLRSPIASAITGLHTLEQMGSVTDASSKEMVSLALVSNQRALDLVNSILDVSKLESGKMEVHYDEVDLAHLVDQCFAHVALWAKTQSVRLAHSETIARATVDPALTTRILSNLLSNALKFSPDEGLISVSIARAGRDGVHFAVQDQGPGIPPEHVDTIFEPFNQVKGTKGGTGLGLTFCRLAVQAQGGKIWVESVSGKGTTMHFVIPHPQDPAAASKPVPEAAS